MMNRSRLYISLILTIGLAVSAVGQDGVHFEFDLEDIICKEQQRAVNLAALSHSRNADADKTDVFYQIMKWEIDPAQYYIKGEITYQFKSKVQGLTQFVLDLTKSLQVNSITSHNQPLNFTHSDDQLLTIELNQPLATGESDILTISYEGMPPSNGFGSFEQGDHAGQPIIWTLSEPYGVRDWWPGKQDLIDKIDSVDIYITTPLGMLAASNGKLISITESNGKSVHHWQHRHPIAAYLVALAVTNYTAYSDLLPLDNGDTIEILNYVYPENLDNAKLNTPNSLQIMALYNELFGTYPFADEKYGHAQFGWGGGMEHQTMSFMYNFSYGLIAHEMAHQWFGDKVTCGSWADIWLNEGFATYLTGLTMQRYSPEIYWPQWKISVSNSVTSQTGGSVFVDDTTNVNRIFSGRLTYNKGAYVLHMLRWVMGDDAFFAACRDYLNNPGTAYDFGRTNELKGYMENQSGLDLDEFFQDWVYDQGYPSYQIQWQSHPDSIVFWVNQTTSHPSVDFFEMPLPIVVSHGGTHVTHVANNTYQNQRFAFPHDGIDPDSVRFDPDIWLLSKNNTVTELTTGTGDPVTGVPFLLYPNPAKDFVAVKGNTEVSYTELINPLGQLIPAELINGRITLSQIPDGLYIVRLQNSKREVIASLPLSVVH